MKEYIRKTLIDAAYRLRIPPARTIVSHFISEHERSIQRLLNLYRTDLVLDVGANTGQFAKSILKCGYRGAIESFEPLAREYQSIQSVLHWYPNWHAHNFALGDVDGEAQIHVAGNSLSSSLLAMAERHEAVAPASAYSDTQTVRVARLDSLFQPYASAFSNIVLKIDAQGFERQILDGAAAALPRITGIVLEVSFAELYVGELLFPEMYARLEQAGFRLCYLAPGLQDPRNGQLLQADAAFFRIGRASPPP